jgi:hypothetical protein
MARRFDSPMLSKMAAQKEAENASQVALDSMARLKATRAAGLAPATRAAGFGKSGLTLNGPPGGVEGSPESVVAHAEQEREGIPLSKHGARCPVDGDLLRHQIGAWMIVEGVDDKGDSKLGG